MRIFRAMKKHSSDLITVRPLMLYALLGMAFGYLMGTLSPLITLFSPPAYFTPHRHTKRNCNCARCNPTIGSLSMVKNGRNSSLETPPLPPGISVPQTDLYMRRLWDNPSEDLPWKPRYLVTFTVGVRHKAIIDRAVRKFSENFTVMLFHYDGKASKWEEFEWSRRAIHVSAPRQTKWWFAKRFLHPDVVAPYEYVFIWDEDLGVQNFDAEEYVRVVEKHGLEISQPALDPRSKGMTWLLTKRKPDVEIHKIVAVPYNNERGGGGRCKGPLLPPCAAFVEMMAPVFSREAWKCVWKLIQNDLVHSWGLDFNFHRCVGGGGSGAYERMGIVDSQWVLHKNLASLGLQGVVKERCLLEARLFSDRLDEVEFEHACCNMLRRPHFTSK